MERDPFERPGLTTPADDTIALRLLYVLADRPAYRFAIDLRRGGVEVGRISLRLDPDPAARRDAGDIGYEIDPAHRGHRYAARACRLLAPIARFHGFTALWIVTAPDNAASRRTAERVGAEYIDTLSLPTRARAKGPHLARRYRWTLPATDEPPAPTASKQRRR